MTSFSPRELQCRIALTMAPAIGPVTARKLISKFGSAGKVFRMNRASLEEIRGVGPLISQSVHSPELLDRAARELEFLERHHISALCIEDTFYPSRLKHCTDAPILLYAKGEKGLRTSRALSVVGTRRASAYGKELCRTIVLELASRVRDLVIVSGLAFGIDVIAHRAALEAKIPTVAVLGHGLNTIYPQAHRETAKRICAQGALITDFHSGTGPERNNFLRRNRIIAGMSDATLVVESAASGGALITADLAFSYDRTVLAVPGRTTDDRSRGCNHLIKMHVAAMVESADDVIEHLNWDSSPTNNPSPQPLLSMTHGFTKQERLLLELLNWESGLMPGVLSKRSGIPIQQVLSLLTEMELKRWIAVEPGNRYQALISLS